MTDPFSKSPFCKGRFRGILPRENPPPVPPEGDSPLTPLCERGRSDEKKEKDNYALA
jgi:hypothetical protein